MSGTARADEGRQLVGSFGPDGTSESNFARAAATASDGLSGDVYVIDQLAGTVEKFGPNGEPRDFQGTAPYITGNEISGLVFSEVAEENQVAVDSTSHILYVTSGNAIRAFSEDGEAADFTAGPGAGGSQIGGFGRLAGVNVDGNGDIYASDFENAAVSVYAPSGELITQFNSTSNSTNVAIAPSGTVYVNQLLGPVFRFDPSIFPATPATDYTKATEPVDANNATALTVDSSSEDLYVVDHPPFLPSAYEVSQYDASGNLVTTFAGPGEEGDLPESAGIAVTGNGAEGVVYVSYFAGPAEASKVEIFAPPPIPIGKPTIDGSTAKDVSAEAVTLTAQINPNTAATTFYVEYGTEDCSQVPDLCAIVAPGSSDIGSGHKFVSVARHLSGLEPGTTYHYRFVAENSFGITEGEEADEEQEDLTFTTQDAGGAFSLLEGRGWELVSPALKQGGGALIPPDPFQGMTLASSGGDRFSFLARGAIDTAPEGNRAPEMSQSLARHNLAGWMSEEVSPPHEFSSTLDFESEYTLFSPDLARAVVEPHGTGPLSIEASERTPYLRENLTEPVRWRPLVTGKEGYANVPPGTEFGGDPVHRAVPPIQVRGASPDLRHVVISSEVGLSDEAIEPLAKEGTLYEWSNGQLQFVSFLPSGQATAGRLGSTVGFGDGSNSHAVSEDGRFVYWSNRHRTALYVRDLEEEETVQIDLPKGVPGEGSPEPVFQGASPDGKRGFFTDPQKLTTDAGTGVNLYECDLVKPTSKTKCILRNISPADGEGISGVQGMVSAINEAGTRVYFVANGALATGASKGNCADNPANSAPGAACNLYISTLEGESWETKFVARLANKDAPDWASTRNLAAASSPSGRYLTFMSEAPLTGYDNRDAASGIPDQEVYHYDATSEEVRCVSCNPTGGLPRGQLAETDEAPLIDWAAMWSGRWVAATLPERNSPGVDFPAFYRPRVVLDNGRVLFNAVDGLVPADANGVADAYEYEPLGVGGCVAGPLGTAATHTPDGGCVGLLSSGASGRETGILDASSSGDDVFFMTTAQLAPQDTDPAYDVYDAHVCGHNWACPPPPPPAAVPCASAGACRSQGPGQEEAAPPPSATLPGEGNLPSKPHKHRHHKKKKAKKRRAAQRAGSGG